MKVLNLTQKNKHDIGYHISHYPDGQINVELELDIDFDEIMIQSRMSSYQDLMVILAATDILRYDGFSSIELYCPYILGSRSDRRFKNYQSFDLKIISNLINSCGFNKVFVCDQHSDVTSALIDNCVNLDAYTSWIQLVDFHWKGDKLLISPDAGAYKKIFPLSEKLGCKVIPGNKIRTDGKPEIIIHGDVKDKDCVIVDDICDGGRTFVELGKLLKEQGAKTVTLFVTHGIFSKGIQLENIDAVYTTNSYQPFDYLMQNNYFHFVNIF